MVITDSKISYFLQQWKYKGFLVESKLSYLVSTAKVKLNNNKYPDVNYSEHLYFWHVDKIRLIGWKFWSPTVENPTLGLDKWTNKEQKGTKME